MPRRSVSVLKAGLAAVPMVDLLVDHWRRPRPAAERAVEGLSLLRLLRHGGHGKRRRTDEPVG
ncbi:hypothetical protein GCM10010306_069650 [Streptomyces umbrinus]|nr:hypothetical protein GCM10010306_069650 [Streptomyces umbrinus]GHH67054.1 hypothetical protein GCM10018775_89920 [Streptomyces umbrinus]